MPPRAKKPTSPEGVEFVPVTEVYDRESSSYMLEATEPEPMPITHNPTLLVTITSAIEWDYGVVKKTFTLSRAVLVASVEDQEREFDKLNRQLEYHHEQWAIHQLPKLRRYGAPIK